MKIIHEPSHMISLICRVLLWWLLLHFVLITRLEYRMSLTGIWLTLVALRKEIVLLLWACWLWIYHHRHIIQLWNHQPLFRLISVLLALTLASTWLVSAFWWYALSSYIMAAKYNLVWFGIGRLGYISGSMVDWWVVKRIHKRYIVVIKCALLLSVLWYAVIVVKPWALKFLWYNQYVYEWTLNAQPPAVYYSEMTSGIQRNQFVFERPITYGFWLVMLWPLFFVAVLRHKPISETRLWWLLYVLAIVVTFSRAARWSWLIQLGILGYRTYQHNFKRFARTVLIPAVMFIIWISALWYHQIFGGWRQFSNTWHINALITSVHAVQDHRFLWRWPGSVGPASHHFGLWYNTENQFLQVWIEYWLVWFIWWLSLFMVIIIGWWRVWIYHRKRNKLGDYLIAYSIGMIGLAISWIVLHPWVDRMVVWPMMVLVGISRWTYISLYNKNSSID